MRIVRRGSHVIYGSVTRGVQGAAQVAPPDHFRRASVGANRIFNTISSGQQGTRCSYGAFTSARAGKTAIREQFAGRATGRCAIRESMGALAQGKAYIYGAVTSKRQGKSRYWWELIRHRRQGRRRVFTLDMQKTLIHSDVTIFPYEMSVASGDPVSIRAEVMLIIPLRVEAEIVKGADLNVN